MTDIDIIHITKDYGEQRGVFDVTFDIRKGEIFGFVGTNGSGKTTTIRQIMGFIQPDDGNIRIRGYDAYKDATTTKQFIGYVPGEIAFPDLPTGTSFIRSQAEFHHLEDLTFADELVRIFQIDLRVNPRKMSKGMKQKTAIIAALMNDSEILILDEPTTGLDPLMRQSFIEVLNREKAKGKTIFITSNIYQELEDLCDRVALIEGGRIIDIVEMEDIRHPKHREYKIEFMTEKDYITFMEKSYDVIRFKDDQFQVIVKVPLEKITQLLNDLSRLEIKFISENPYRLEKYFKEKYHRLHEEGEAYDQ